MFESSTLVASLRRSWGQMIEMLPDLALAVLLLIAGWLVAKLARRVAVRVLRTARVDEFAERWGVDDFLVQGGVPLTTSSLLGGTVYWAILATVFVTLLDALGVKSAGLLAERTITFIPNLILATGILVFGTLLARAIGTFTFSYLSNIGSPAAEPVGALARYAMLVFALFMAAEQLAIRSEVLVSAFQIAFASVCLAAALAFGLGGREWAAQVIARYTRK
jgi:hypothetical protein